MSFSLYQVTQRAAGGEIARTRKIATEAPIIGRGADCDIHLPDLAVDLHHARMSEGADGLVLVEALGLLGFEVGGRFTRRAELDLARGAEVAIGRNRLILSRAVDGDVMISISAMEGADSVGAADERAIFDPPSPLFGRRPLAWALGLGILLMCLAAPATLFFLHNQRTIHADRQWTSGPLSRSHAFLNNDCQACHAKAFVAVRDEACLSCHRAGGPDPVVKPRLVQAPGGPPPMLIRVHAPADRLLAGAPYPADLPGRLTAWLDKTVDHPNDRCASCHLEHVPASGGAPPASEQPRDKPPLKIVNDCAACHASLKSRLPVTTLRDTPDWSRHPDFRPYVAVGYAGGKVLVRREGLAGGAAAATGLIFSHKMHLAPAGGVARVALELGVARGYGRPLDCGACHHADADGRGFRPVDMERDCRGCHTMAFARDASGVRVLPHGQVQKLVAFLQSFYGASRAAIAARPAEDAGRRRPGETLPIPTTSATPLRRAPGQAAALVRASGAPGGACAFCHRISPSPSPGSGPFVVDPTPQLMRHMPAGGFDHGVTAHHQDAAAAPNCGACHAARASDSAAALLLPPIARCRSCHGARVAGTPAVVPASSGCAECHDYHAPGQPNLNSRERRQIIAWRPRLTNIS